VQEAFPEKALLFYFPQHANPIGEQESIEDIVKMVHSVDEINLEEDCGMIYV